jgi:dihydropteroate synthase
VTQHRELRLGPYTLALERGAHVMGIVNASPDSFYDGGRHAGVGARIAHARRLVAAGAAIIDVGGQTGSVGDEISVAEEIERTQELVAAVADLGVPVSIDTYRAAVAEAAIAAGAVLVNDYTGFYDPDLPEVVAASGAGIVCAHYRGRPRSNASRSYAVGVAEVAEALAERREEALVAGVGPDSILLDPCFGFGKDTRSDVALLAAIPRLRALGAPVLAAISHKEFTADATGLEESDLRGTLAAAVLAARAGADVIRLHDVAEIAPVIRLADAVRRAEWEDER